MMKKKHAHVAVIAAKTAHVRVKKENVHATVIVVKHALAIVTVANQKKNK